MVCHACPRVCISKARACQGRKCAIQAEEQLRHGAAASAATKLAAKAEAAKAVAGAEVAVRAASLQKEIGTNILWSYGFSREIFPK